MNTEYTQFVATLLKRLAKLNYIKPGEVPNIDLYMDQVTTFMDEQLEACKRYEDDKILTKTMINNYAKNNLLPAPEKKKYSKEHVLTLLFIYYFKNLLSINDIQSLLNPLTEHYFGNKAGFNMEDVYNEVFNLESTESEKLLKDLGKKYALSRETFRKFPENDQEFLQNFSFICLLSYDVYIKKMIIDNINSQNSKTNKKENSKKEFSKKDTV